ncbi:hypothetical protein PENTCL1PPCAC_15689 [Pristionchus entomophagus]|uniref:Uncharacterized protein n=1 Tax=Pristionchus entomophagus TaxID=358040 RepID=A0AAV5TDU5_9BILA|nr:hypothetical protein PENTCL1PPCAC_15689 [Pristionchus entomophagus]
MHDFPARKHSLLHLGDLLETEKFIAFPSMEMLAMQAETHTRMFSDAFFNLIDSHKSLHLDMVDITLKEFESVIEILSADFRSRTLQFRTDVSVIAHWLRNNGITVASKTGDHRGEIEIIVMDQMQNTMRCRYRNCVIELISFSFILLFSSGEGSVFVIITRGIDN